MHRLRYLGRVTSNGARMRGNPHNEAPWIAHFMFHIDLLLPTETQLYRIFLPIELLDGVMKVLDM